MRRQAIAVVPLRLNWTKVGLKAAEADGDEALAGGLNWTKVGLKVHKTHSPSPGRSLV